MTNAQHRHPPAQTTATSNELNDICRVAMTYPCFSTGVHATDIRLALFSTFFSIPPSHHHLFFTRHTVLIPHLLNLGNFIIYPCSQALQRSLFLLISYPTMVGTRMKNKTTHPAAIVMSKAVKEKASIPMKKCTKWVTKDNTIRELQAQIAKLENPAGPLFSKEPLVSNLQLCLDYGANDSQFLKGSSPLKSPSPVLLTSRLPSLKETETGPLEDPDPDPPTEIDSDSGVFSGQKCVTDSDPQDPR